VTLILCTCFLNSPALHSNDDRATSAQTTLT